MKKFIQLITEELNKRSLKIAPLFLENKIYVDINNINWLVESVDENEIVATNTETSETQSFTPDEFAKQITIPEPVDNSQSDNKLQKVAQELRQEGLNRIQQGQELCDKCNNDKDHEDYAKGQALLTQGYNLLKQADELKEVGDSENSLNVNQQQAQFLQNKEIIENGQKLVEQGQIVIDSIKVNPDEIIKIQKLISQAQQLIQQGCKEIKEGQQKQNKQILISQQDNIDQLQSEVVEQCQFLQNQISELKDELVKLDQNDEIAEIIKQCDQITQEAQEVIDQEDNSVSTSNTQENPVEIIKETLKTIAEQITQLQVSQAQNKKKPEICQQLDDIETTISEAQTELEKCSQNEVSELSEELQKQLKNLVNKIDAGIKIIKPADILTQKVLVQSQLPEVKKIDASIKIIKENCKKIKTFIK